MCEETVPLDKWTYGKKLTENDRKFMIKEILETDPEFQDDLSDNMLYLKWLRS